MDWSALKDLKTTMPGLVLICLTILILAGKVDVNKLPLDAMVSLALGSSGVVLLGAKSSPQPPPDPPTKIQVQPGPFIPAGLPVADIADCGEINPTKETP